MAKNYVLNPNTGRIHILDFCHRTRPCPKEWKRFYTEEDARADYGGQSAGLCKDCLRKREEELQKEKKEK